MLLRALRPAESMIAAVIGIGTVVRVAVVAGAVADVDVEAEDATTDAAAAVMATAVTAEADTKIRSKVSGVRSQEPTGKCSAVRRHKGHQSKKIKAAIRGSRLFCLRIQSYNVSPAYFGWGVVLR